MEETTTMAVIKSKRQENPLQVLSMALGLAVHTLTVCKNEKLFPSVTAGC